MFFRQVLHEDLGCASYVVADSGEAAVIDPKWDVGEYLELAAEHGFTIAHILETHNHADHVSGRGRLAAATAATIHVPVNAGVAYAHEPLADGDEVAIGDVRIRALAAPGHRPEHTAYLVVDAARSDVPWLLLSGDSLFVGDLARPDLAVEPHEGAVDLFRSLRRLDGLDGAVELWPGHIGGSLCGGAGMSEKPSSTLGYERLANPLVARADERTFVAELTGMLGPQPPNFRRIVELNRGPLVTEPRPLPGLSAPAVQRLLDEGAILVDGRAPRSFDGEHVPGSVSVTMVQSAVGTRAAWVIDADAPVVTAATSDADATEVAARLQAAGFSDLRGYLEGGIEGWKTAGLPVHSTPALDVAGLAAALRDRSVRLVDVREREEWDAGHVEGSLHVPFHDLRDGVPPPLREAGAPLAIACSAGNRSALAASLLRRAGVAHVVHVADGGVHELPAHGVALAAEPAAAAG